jgi:hypothetical protein
MERPIFVVCDRCRAEGHSGEDPFQAFGALLDFDPVPRRRLIVDEDGLVVEPVEVTWPIDGDWRSHAEQNRRFDEQHEADARAQFEWEARARQEAAAWRARPDSEDPSAWLCGENEP